MVFLGVFFFYLLNEAAPAVLMRPRPCIFSLSVCQEQDSREQGEGRKGWEVREAMYCIGHTFISIESGPFPLLEGTSRTI